MAVSSSPQPPFLSPLRLATTSNLIPSPSNLSLIAFPSEITARRRRPAIVFSSKSKNDTVSDQDRALLLSYGFDPDEILSEPSPKKERRKKELQKTGRGKQVPVVGHKPPRETHKLLQVLGGKARRKKLISPKGQHVRPMMEVVKGAAFDILQVAGGCPASLRPGRWLDLYSGTGSVGIEALSRGCAEVHFVEMDPWVVSDVLRPNLEWTGFVDVSVIHTVRVETFLERAAQSAGATGLLVYQDAMLTEIRLNLMPKAQRKALLSTTGKDGQFNYISVTPPYTEVDYAVLMDQISKSSLVGEDTFIVVEYPLGTDMLDSCGCLIKITDRRFGRTNLAIYGPQWAQKRRKPEKSIRAVAEKV